MADWYKVEQIFKSGSKTARNTDIQKCFGLHSEIGDKYSWGGVNSNLFSIYAITALDRVKESTLLTFCI
jgi:hypothetical protein